MSRRRQLQFIHAMIRAELQDKLTRAVLIAFTVCAAINLLVGGIH